MRNPYVTGGKETPCEELTAPRFHSVKLATSHNDGDHVGAFVNNLFDPQFMTKETKYWNYKSPVKNNETNNGVKTVPVVTIDRVGKEHWPGSNLMHETEGNSEVGIKMYRPPSFVGHLFSYLFI